MNRNSNILILGAGISSLSAGYYLREKGCDSIILEKDDSYGGLCNNFEIDGFLFDRFIHLSFSNDDEVNRVFALSTGFITHIPNPYNIYKKRWIKHPAQNNLYPLDEEEKAIIIEDFKKRPIVLMDNIDNYEEWLRVQYGDYFAEHFPMAYTRKYWMCEAVELETKWVGNRLYQPSVEEVEIGSKTSDTPVTYYAKEMRYPQKGGYKSFLSELAKELDIRCNNEIISIDSKNRKVITSNGDRYHYNELISSLPLPEIVKMLDNVPEKVIIAANKLKCTSGYLVSIGLRTKNIPPYLWWYIYDEDILPARIYSPSLKSPNNAPPECSSLQMEIYCKEGEYSKNELYDRSVKKLIVMGIIREEDIIFTDIRFEKYANIVFDHEIYKNRLVVRNYVESLGIKLIGRFGEWDYLWSDQSFLSGKRIVEGLNF